MEYLRRLPWMAMVMSISIVLFLQTFPHLIYLKIPRWPVNGTESWCLLPNASTILDHGDDLRPSLPFLTNASIQTQVERLSAAVRIPTESWDDNGDVGTDPRWEIFGQFHIVLQKLFPLVHERAHLEKPNRYNLIFTITGTSASSNPILLAAHQDVVPADSASKWTHPPFEPYFDGQYLWGRGSSDCKNNLIGILSALESLLEQGWKPSRTVIAAFGFDEETGGVRGATNIARLLEEKWGRNGFALVLDEGGMGLTTMGNLVYARPGIAEKGYLDIKLTLEVEGGHSSEPPSHSGIGIMAEFIVALEKNPYKPVLTKENPLRRYLECQAKFSPRELEPWLHQALIDGTDGQEIGRRLSKERGSAARFSMQTSQAVDIIRGGQKVNALPKKVETTVNYRIATHDSLEVVKLETTRILKPIAQKHGLTLHYFGQKNSEPDRVFSPRAVASLTTLQFPTQGQISGFTGALFLNSSNDLSPSPISPTNVENDVWRLFSTTIRQVFENTTTLAGKTVIPVGDIMHGNTDTIHYWNLTKNIYRFSPLREGTKFGIHTIDEHMDMTAHVEGLRFYYGKSFSLLVIFTPLLVFRSPKLVILSIPPLSKNANTPNPDVILNFDKASLDLNT